MSYSLFYEVLYPNLTPNRNMTEVYHTDFSSQLISIQTRICFHDFIYFEYRNRKTFGIGDTLQVHMVYSPSDVFLGLC